MNITTERKQTIKGPGGLRLELDADQIFPDDPGQGTPCLLEMRDEDGRIVTATFNCAIGEGEVEYVMLAEDQMNWLNELEYPVDTWLTNWVRQISKENKE